MVDIKGKDLSDMRGIVISWAKPGRYSNNSWNVTISILLGLVLFLLFKMQCQICLAKALKTKLSVNAYMFSYSDEKSLSNDS